MSNIIEAPHPNDETHDTPYGRRYVAAAFGDEIWVGPIPLKALPHSLSDRPGLRPHSQIVMFTVLRAEDGTREAMLRSNPRRRPPPMDAAFDHAQMLATKYANEHADYMDELLVSQRTERLAEIERLVANIPTKNEAWLTADLKQKAERVLLRLPEPWQRLLRDTEPTYEAMRAAPPPLGPLFSRGGSTSELEGAVFEVIHRLRSIRWIEDEEEGRRAVLRAEATALQEEADREMILSTPAPF